MPLVTTTPGNFDDIISTTLQLYAPRIEDNFYNALPFWHFMNKAGAVKEYRGGESFVVPVLYADNTTAKAMTSAYDDISVTPQNNITVAQYLPRQYVVSITISRAEKLKNTGAAQAIDLLTAKCESAELAVRNLLNTHLWSDSSVAGSILGIQDAIEAAAAASQDNVVGGISKATYTWWRNQYQTASDAFGTNGRRLMATVYHDCSGGSSDHPTLIGTTQATYENFERSLEPIERMTPGAGSTGDPRFETLKFRGALLFWDEAAPADRMYFLNPRYIYLKVHADDHFEVLPFVKFPNQTAYVAQISWTGQIIMSNSRRLGVLAATDTF